MVQRRSLAAAALAGAIRPARAQQGTAPVHTPDMVHGRERIAFLIYPGFTALDVFGPHNMLAGLMPERLDLVAATREPVRTDTGISILPTASFAEIEPGLDVLCVPGGTRGTLAAMADPATIAFLARQGAAARWVTSVCTGALVLGAAGLLRGYRATGHWLLRDLLSIFGAEPVNARVVTDRNRMTGGGVTAGIDFGLTLVARMRDPAYARAVQLVAEYDPEPPFRAGTPATAPAETVTFITDMFADFVVEAREASQAAARRMPG